MSENSVAKKELFNGLQELAIGLGFGGNPWEGNTISNGSTFIESAAYSPFSLNRTALSYGYMSYGLVQTLVDQPVEDAFRGGLEIESDELDEKDMALLHQAMRANGDVEAIKGALKWSRLYGGSGLIIATNQEETALPLNESEYAPGQPLKFVSADRWELILSVLGIGFITDLSAEFQPIAPYNYYGVQLNQTRVLPLFGREAPSFIRQRLQGWGMSELERCMREIDTYIKFQNLLFDLVDEAKVDIYRMQGFNDLLATAQGTQLVQNRIQCANMIKDYKNALTMDMTDEYEQKQLTFSGLADIMEQFRINLAASLKIPLNKLFGQSATGFSSGEDAMENYNALVESDIREPIGQLVDQVIRMRCFNTFGFEPTFTARFKPLRVLDAEQEEKVNDAKFNRAVAMYDRNLLDGQETMESLHKDKLLNVDSEVLNGTREPDPMAMQGGNEFAGDGKPPKKQDKAEKKNDRVKWLQAQKAYEQSRVKDRRERILAELRA